MADLEEVKVTVVALDTTEKLQAVTDMWILLIGERSLRRGLLPQKENFCEGEGLAQEKLKQSPLASYK